MTILKTLYIPGVEQFDPSPEPRQSFITVGGDSPAPGPSASFADVVHGNVGVGHGAAGVRVRGNEFEQRVVKKKNLKTTETGAEIIMSKYLDSYINFEIYNIQSRNELNRIISFIKIGVISTFI